MIDTLFSGLIHGGAYALVAVGVSLIFGVTNVVNFAQGSLVAVGMMLAWYCGSVLGWPHPRRARGRGGHGGDRLAHQRRRHRAA